MKTSIAQGILARNKKLIQVVQHYMKEAKRNKREADESGDTDTEYAAHSVLKQFRAGLHKLVAEQKELKKIIKDSKVVTATLLFKQVDDMIQFRLAGEDYKNQYFVVPQNPDSFIDFLAGVCNGYHINGYNITYVKEEE